MSNSERLTQIKQQLENDNATIVHKFQQKLNTKPDFNYIDSVKCDVSQTLDDNLRGKMNLKEHKRQTRVIRNQINTLERDFKQFTDEVSNKDVGMDPFIHTN